MSALGHPSDVPGYGACGALALVETAALALLETLALGAAAGVDAFALAVVVLGVESDFLPHAPRAKLPTAVKVRSEHEARTRERERRGGAFAFEAERTAAETGMGYRPPYSRDNKEPGKAALRRASRRARGELFARRSRVATTLDDAAGVHYSLRVSSPEPRIVFCKKLQKELPGVRRQPYKNELGKQIYDNVSQEAWEMWLKDSVRIINTYRVDLASNEGQRFMLKQAAVYFGFEDGEVAETAWVPPPGSAGAKEPKDPA
jgi:Fe-S cluster biosynthesis and repair protein YggX